MKKTLSLTLLLALLGVQVQAQERPAMKACAADVKTLCAGVERGEGRIAQCLRDKQDKVSEGCKAALKKARESGARPDKPASAPKGS